MNIEIENFSAFYQATGSGPNGIIFIHGLGGDHQIWRKNVEPFSTDHRVISVDLFGHGLSTKIIEAKKAWTLIPELFQAIIKKEKLERVTFVGHSIAGLILQEYASEHISDLLILVDCAINDEALIADRESTCQKMLSLPTSELPLKTREFFQSFTQPGKPEDDDIIFSPLNDLKCDWIYRFIQASNFIQPKPKADQRTLIIESSVLAVDYPQYSFRHAFPSAELIHIQTHDHYFFVRESQNFNEILRANL